MKKRRAEEATTTPFAEIVPQIMAMMQTAITAPDVISANLVVVFVIVLSSVCFLCFMAL